MCDVLARRGVLHNELFAPPSHFLKALPGAVLASGGIVQPPIGVPFDNSLLGRRRSGRWARRHSMTSSARASNDRGTSSPSVLAVLMLSTSWYLVGACTGRSAGFSPLRMRST